MGFSKLILPKGMANAVIIPDKNPHWEFETPNERLLRDSQYKELCLHWKRDYRIAGVLKFAEVRITKDVSSTSDWVAPWWVDSIFMDHVFWLFFKPTSVMVDGVLSRVFFLEPYECMRVVASYEIKYGYNKLKTNSPALVLPEDVVTRVWNETTNGVSDHLKERIEIPLSAEEEDQEGVLEEQKKKILETARPIDETWHQAADTIAKRSIDWRSSS